MQCSISGIYLVTNCMGSESRTNECPSMWSLGPDSMNENNDSDNNEIFLDLDEFIYQNSGYYIKLNLTKSESNQAVCSIWWSNHIQLSYLANGKKYNLSLGCTRPQWNLRPNEPIELIDCEFEEAIRNKWRRSCGSSCGPLDIRMRWIMSLK